MRNGEYGLGIDVGDGAVSAAVCSVDGGAVPLPLGQGRVTAVVGDDGRTVLVPADGTARGPHLVARVGDPVPVYAGGHGVPAAELVADVVQRVRELAAEREGRPDAWTVVTVPPSWAGHRCAVLARALGAAGVPRFSLVSSAVAAVSAHVAAGDLPAEPRAAVYDLGAGTLDTAVVGPTAEHPLAHLAVPPAPLPWGGRDVDDVVVAHVVGCLGTAGGDAGALRAACATAKEALSTATAVRVAVDDAGDGPVRLTREELDEVLDGPVRRSAGVLAAAVAAAGLVPEDLDAVVLTGGGVRVPLVAEVLSGELGRPLVVGDDPALTPALGAAGLAAQALAVDATGAEVAATGTAAVAAPAAAPAVAAAEEPQPALPRARRPRDRSRPASAVRGATRPPLRRAGRLGRGVVLTGLVLAMLLLGPAAAGLFDAVLAPAPTGQEAVAEADDGGVVARGSAAVGDTGSPAERGGDTADATAPPTSAGSPGSPARTSLAAALATAARTGPPSESGSTEPSAGRTAPGSTTAASGTTPRGTATPTPGTATAQTPSAPGTSSGPTTSAGTPPSGPTPVDPTPVDPTPSDPTPSDPTPVDPTPSNPTPSDPTPSDPTPVDPTPVDPPAPPAPEQPAAEEPAAEQPAAEPAPPPADEGTSTTGPA